MLLLLYFIVFVSNNKFTREPPQKLSGFDWKILNVIEEARHGFRMENRNAETSMKMSTTDLRNVWP